MKKLVVLLLCLLLAGNAYAAMGPTYASGNTVAYSTTGHVVSFNSVTEYIEIYNESQTTTLYVDLRGVDANGKRGFVQTSTSGLIKVGPSGASGNSDNTVKVNFSTGNIGFLGEGSGNCSYRVIGLREL